jgi:hypothetical protein
MKTPARPESLRAAADGKWTAQSAAGPVQKPLSLHLM